jgi:L-2-hydroxyglutarate oxidase LhgO
MADVDLLVIGGGVTGLACALSAAKPDRAVAVLDAHPRFGAETSTHNSGVIHAGIYYPAGTLKARLCVEGRDRLYAYCARHGVSHARCGKLIVASTEAGSRQLEALARRAEANGVTDIVALSPADVRAREPFVRAHAALLSPSSGIVSAEELIRAYSRDCASKDVALLPGTRVVGGEPETDGVAIVTERERIVARAVVNAAGLYADDVSRLLGGEDYRIYPCRGEYAELTPKWRGRFAGPVYPLPHPSGHGLGVHVTPTTWGSTLLGPTAEYQERKDDYEDNRMPIDAFLESTRALLPDVTLADLQPGGTGIRAKLHPPEESFADFMIRRDSRQPALVHAAGIDSPGLTASLAIGAMVAGIVKDMLD